MSIDISIGDIITLSAVKYEFGGIFDYALKVTALHRGSLEKIVNVKEIFLCKRNII